MKGVPAATTGVSEPAAAFGVAVSSRRAYLDRLRPHYNERKSSNGCFYAFTNVGGPGDYFENPSKLNIAS